ncbi:MAG: M20/M25/M40 family metallo-hydrolase, partial [Saprospiraceae bacterium]|nr:M20/M25/M40 family metallo-hydrolase [Saprospiraceae bacterium]
MRSILMRILIAVCLMIVVLPLQAQIQGDAVVTIDEQYGNQVKSMTQLPQVQQILSHIEEHDAQTLRDHIALTEIPAPPFAETERAIAFRDMLSTLGVDSIWIDSVGNVLALRKGSGSKTVVLDAHLDTVFPIETDVTVKVKGDTLYAPGIADDTRGLAMVLAIARALQEADVKT